jgi:hypothetical protein
VVTAGLALSVVATTEAGTRAALLAADDLGVGLVPHIVLWVPHVVPYAQPLDHPADDVTFTATRFRTLAEEIAADVFVRVCVCRSDAAGLEAILPRDDVVLVGGASRRWWQTREQRLAQRLAAHGYSVLYIDAGVMTPAVTRSIECR